MSYLMYKEHYIHYISEGSGRTIIFLPGNTASSAAHQWDVHRYADRYLSVSLDFLGTGASDRLSPWPLYWWDECARQTAVLIDHLGGQKALLVGTSGGAVIALKTAIIYPDKVSGVIADSFSLEFTRDMYENNILKERAYVSKDKAAFWMLMHGEDWREVIREDTRMIKSFVDKRDGQWFPKGLRGLSCPALFSASMKDSSISNPSSDMVAAMRQAKQASIYLHHSGGHPFMWTTPDLFTSLLECLIKEIDW